MVLVVLVLLGLLENFLAMQTYQAPRIKNVGVGTRKANLEPDTCIFYYEGKVCFATTKTSLRTRLLDIHIGQPSGFYDTCSWRTFHKICSSLITTYIDKQPTLPSLLNH